MGASPLLLSPIHESGFVGELIGIGARLACENLVESFGCNGENSRLEDVGPIVLGEIA